MRLTFLLVIASRAHSISTPRATPSAARIHRHVGTPISSFPPPVTAPKPFNPRDEYVLITKQQVRQLNRRIEQWIPLIGQWSIFGGITVGGAAAITGLGSAGVLSMAKAVSIAKVYSASVAWSTTWTLAANRFLGGGHRICKQFRGRLVDPNSAFWLMRDVRNTATEAGLPYTPAVYIIPSQEPNAFAAGTTPKTSVVAVTSGLLSTLSPREVKAVIAHEMGHARHSDVGRMMQSAAMTAGFSSTLRLGLDMISGKSEKDSDDDDNGVVAGAVLAGVGAVTYTAGSLLRLASSRTAEYRADAFAQEIGLGAPLASALEKIEQASYRVTRDELGTTGVYSHMYISNEPKHDMWSSVAGWLATHPPTSSRVEKLRGKAPPHLLPAPRPQLSGGWSALRDAMEDPPAF